MSRLVTVLVVILLFGVWPRLDETVLDVTRFGRNRPTNPLRE